MRAIGLILVTALALGACSPPSEPKPKDAPSEAPSQAAVATPMETLACKADHTLSCSAAGCESKPDDYLQVELTFAPDAGAGSLCTFTFCRGVALVSTGDKLSGHLLSASSGSTEPEASRPNMDYALTIAPDRKTFALMSFAEGRFSGYGGACAPATP